MSDHEEIKKVLRESIEASLNHISPMALTYADPYIEWMIESAIYSLDANGYLIVPRVTRPPHPSAPAPAAAIGRAAGAATGESKV